MRKLTVLSLALSLSYLPVLYFSTFSSPGSAHAKSILTKKVENTGFAFSEINYAESTLPLEIPDGSLKEIEELHDPALQEKLDKILNSNAKWTQLAKNKALSIGVVDMNDPENSKFAAINGHEMMYAASLPKIAILLASEDAIASGKLKETSEVKQDMRLMISKSSNSAATRMIERVGIDHISEVLQHSKYNLYDEKKGGGLWVGKAYGKGGTRKGDPLKNLSHAASVTQVAKFYYLLAFGKLVNPERSRHMLQMMSDPELHHKFVSVLKKVAPNAKVYRKSGSWENWHADSALVWSKERRYIVVALSNDSNGESMLRELMLKIDTSLVSNS